METSVIPNKYLNYNYQSDGDLVVADNVVNENGILKCRPGWDWIATENKPLNSILADANYLVPVNGLFFNGSPFFFFKDYLSGETQFGYRHNLSDVKNPNSGAWRMGSNQNAAFDFGAFPSQYKPQMHEGSKRLLIGSNRGLLCVPRMQQDYTIGNFWRGATPRIAGSASALGFVQAASYLTDTTATYNQNWLPPGAQVAYRCVWSFFDVNGQYVYGSVSDRLVVRNTLTTNQAVAFSVIVPSKIIDIMNDAFQLIPSCEIYRTRTQPADDAGLPIDPGDEMYFAGELRPATTPSVASTITFTDIYTDSVLQDPLYTNELQDGALASRFNIPPHKTAHVFDTSYFFGNYWEPWINSFELGSTADLGLTGPAIPNRRGLRTNGTRGDVLILGDIAIEANTVAPNKKQFQLSAADGVTSQVTRVVESARSLVSQYNQSAIEAGGRYRLFLDNGPNDFVGKLRLMSRDNEDVASLSDQNQRPFVGLVRVNGWNNAADPSPISPDPRINDNKGIGFRINQVSAPSLGVWTFDLGTPPDFVPGDRIQIAAFNNNDTNSSVTSFMMQFTGSQVVGTVSGNTFTLINPATGLSWLNPVPLAYNTATVDPASVTIGVGACMCVQDSLTSKVSQAAPDDNYFPARLAFTPPSQPESFKMLTDWIIIGDATKQIIGIGAVGDNLLVFKEDGLYRVIGQYPEYQVIQADETCILWGGDNLASGDSACYAFGQKGLYKITLNAVEIISDPISTEVDRIIKTSDPKPAYVIAHRGRNVIEFWYRDPLIADVATGVEHCNSAFVWDGEGWTKRVEPMAISFTGTNYDYSDSEVQFGFRPFANMALIERVTSSNDDMSDEAFLPARMELDPSSRLVLRFAKNTYPLDNVLFTAWIAENLAFARIKTNQLAADRSSDLVTLSVALPYSDQPTYKEFYFDVQPELLATLESENKCSPISDFYAPGFSFNLAGFELLKRINKRIVWFVGGDQTSRKRVPLWGIDFVQPRFYYASQLVRNDITFNELPPTEFRFFGYGFGPTNGLVTNNNLLINVPMNNMANKFIPLSVQREQQDGYCFYMEVLHNFGGDVFSVRAIRASAMSGNIQISRNTGSNS